MAPLVDEVEPDELYNLAGISSVAFSWEQPVADRPAQRAGPGGAPRGGARASRSAPDGGSPSSRPAAPRSSARRRVAPQDERTPVAARSRPTARRRRTRTTWSGSAAASGLHASTSCILFNHESPRRPTTFVTRKITAAAARIGLRGHRGDPRWATSTRGETGAGRRTTSTRWSAAARHRGRRRLRRRDRRDAHRGGVRRGRAAPRRRRRRRGRPRRGRPGVPAAAGRAADGRRRVARPAGSWAGRRPSGSRSSSGGWSTTTSRCCGSERVSGAGDAVRPGVVSVVLVNYKGAEDTITCLRAFDEVDWPADRLELVVVDNDSQDGSAERIRDGRAGRRGRRVRRQPRLRGRLQPRGGARDRRGGRVPQQRRAAAPGLDPRRGGRARREPGRRLRRLQGPRLGRQADRLRRRLADLVRHGLQARGREARHRRSGTPPRTCCSPRARRCSYARRCTARSAASTSGSSCSTRTWTWAGGSTCSATGCATCRARSPTTVTTRR